MATTFCCFAILVVLFQLCSAAPGAPNFDDAVISGYGPMTLNVPLGLTYGGIGNDMSMLITVTLNRGERNPPHSNGFDNIFANTGGFLVGTQSNEEFFPGKNCVIAIIGRTGITTGCPDIKVGVKTTLLFNYAKGVMSIYVNEKLGTPENLFTEGTESRAPMFIGPFAKRDKNMDITRVGLWKRALLPGEIMA